MLDTESEKKNKTSSNTDVNWSQYGLNNSSVVQQRPNYGDTSALMQGSPRRNELFLEDQETFGKQWWKSNFFLSEPILFGTWDGVYTSCLIHLFGVIVFLRTGWIVGNAGIGLSSLIILTSVAICSIAVLAAIGICQRCSLLSNGGNVHVLISNVLGSKIGGSVSIIYCFGQAVSCALHVMGFAETLAKLLTYNDIWFERMIGIALIIILLVINVAGVKWVIRLQFVLLIFLILAAIDFLVGVFIRIDPDNGVVGMSFMNFKANWQPVLNDSDMNLFTIFGVFFPAVTGVMAGINMSGDLSNPSQSIPVGTFSAIGTSLLLYLSFAFGLGAACTRDSLLHDYMIAQKASSIGIFLLIGLYISSLSYCLGSLYATPRIIQNISNENIIPVLKVLSRGRGPNKVPVNALIIFSLITFIFIMIGKINVLAPIVTIPYLLTYATIEYAYFSLDMTFDIQILRESRFMASIDVTSPTFDTSGHKKGAKHSNYGAVKDNDLDLLFPERVQTKHIVIKRQQSSQTSSSTSSVVQSPDGQQNDNQSSSADESYESTDSSVCHSKKLDLNEIKCKQNDWNSWFTNKWLIIMGAIIKIIIMFLVQWGYALSVFIILAFLCYYIGQVNPGLFPGISEFKFYPWVTSRIALLFRKRSTEYDQMILSSGGPDVQTLANQLTAENKDYAGREPYHQSLTANKNLIENK